MIPAREFDVAVIGGGPAGATAARRLTQIGHRVALLHRPRRDLPSNPAWETLSPGSLELLRHGNPAAWPRIAELLLPCGASVLWSHGEKERTSDRPVALVDRRALDPLLRELAVEAGATPIDGGRAISRENKPWLVAGDGVASFRCTFLVDAAGRHSALPAVRKTHSPRTIALTARVLESSLGKMETRVEALRDAWLWAARGAEASASVTLFVDLETARRWSRSDRAAALLDCLHESSLATSAPLLLASGIGAADATIAERPPIFRDGLARIGDAALSLDPLASQGIHHALLSARHAAAAIHTSLVAGGHALAARFVQARHEEALQQHRAACAALYRRQNEFVTLFWADRSGNATDGPPPATATPQLSAAELLQTSFALCPRVRWETLPVLAGDLIEARPALSHPNLSRPVAFLDGKLLGDLLADFPQSLTGAALVARWLTKQMTPAAASRALIFLHRHKVLLSSAVGSQPILRRLHRLRCVDAAEAELVAVARGIVARADLVRRASEQIL